jgi:3-hydroxybutyryl-CoA dehydrogenase
MSQSIQRIAVCGAGTMGAGIAQVAAAAGFDTLLSDINATMLEKAKAGIYKNWTTAIEKGKMTNEAMQAAQAKLQFVTTLEQTPVDMVIEAIIERLDIKQKLFCDIAAWNNEQTIIVSNTSSLSITQIAAGVPHPERVAGMHFFNPAHLMKLVEVVEGAATSNNTMQLVKAVAEKMGKTVVLTKDAPGFIVNRVARHYYVENLKLAEEGVADLNTLDNLCENAGFKMGAFRLMDLIGNDINFAVTSSLFNAFHQDSKFRPSRIQEQKVLAGHLGRKTGKGFYDYNK